MGKEDKAFKILRAAELRPTEGRVEKLAELIGELSDHHVRNIKLEIVHHGGNAHRLAGDERARQIGSMKTDGKIMEIWAVW